LHRATRDASLTHVPNHRRITMHARRQPTDSPAPARRRLIGRAPRTRSVIAATGVLVICIAPFAAARTGRDLREGVRNGTATKETQIIGKLRSSTTTTGGYVTRQSNLSTDGGGAVYGCRSKAGGSAATPRPQNPCIRANNLSTGFAFEFNASNGDVGGLFSVGAGGDTKKPFTTNATGVATGLNADRVDNLDAAQIVAAARAKTGLDADTVDGKDSTDLLPRFAQVTSAGTLGETRGVPATGGLTHAGTGVYVVTFTGDLSKCAVSATLTGATFGEITATPAVVGANTAVTVRTAGSGGTPADHDFHTQVTC
jgi:hypothetical protein